MMIVMDFLKAQAHGGKGEMLYVEELEMAIAPGCSKNFPPIAFITSLLLILRLGLATQLQGKEKTFLLQKLATALLRAECQPIEACFGQYREAENQILEVQSTQLLTLPQKKAIKGSSIHSRRLRHYL